MTRSGGSVNRMHTFEEVEGTRTVISDHTPRVRAAQSSERFRVANERLDSFTKFLRLVSDGQPTSVAAVSADGLYTFANAKTSLPR